MGAERLPIRCVPEQRLIAAMRNNVIDHRRGLAAQLTVLAFRQEPGAGLVPLGIVTPLPSRWPGAIRLGQPFTAAAARLQATLDGVCADDEPAVSATAARYP